MNGVFISVVVPFFNEEAVIPVLYERLFPVLESLQQPYEIIFVDDGSSDGSLRLILELRSKNAAVKCLSFSRNFGHQTAISAGLEFARGSAVVVIDADLQDPPEMITAFIGKWKEGFEVVYGVRPKRHDSFPKVALCNFYYRMLKFLSRTEINLDSGDFCLMDRRVVDLLKSIPEKNRFMRGTRDSLESLSILFKSCLSLPLTESFLFQASL
jgi:polyisoprenyl-phosphate glycosyltransferase